MPRKPLLPTYARAGVELGPGFLETRPHVAAEIARCVGLWSDVEFQNAQFLASLLHATAAPAVAVYLALKNSRTRQDVLAAAARAVLNDRNYELFGAIQRVGASLESQRNDIVHGLYGKSDQIPDGVLWMSSHDRIKHSLALGSMSAASRYVLRHEAIRRLRQDIFVYEISDLMSLAAEIETHRQNVQLFTGLHGQKDTPSADELYLRLCSSPRIREALSRIRADRQKSSQAPP
jgi:hypothetical protein